MAYKEAPQPDPIETKFNQHAEALVAGTCYATTRREVQVHPDYQAIVDQGVQVLPYVLEASELSYFPGFMILQDITGENPVPKHDMGNKQAMTNAWTVHIQKNYPDLKLR